VTFLLTFAPFKCEGSYFFPQILNPTAHISTHLDYKPELMKSVLVSTRLGGKKVKIFPVLN